MSKYPAAINLPFNFSSIKDEFVFSKRSSNLPDGNGSWIIIQGGNVIIEETSSGPVLPSGALPEWIKANQEPVCIGYWRGRPIRALTISSSLSLEHPWSAEPFNAVEERLDIQSLTLAGLAKQVLHWERQSSHCYRCGSVTDSIEGSWGKRCKSCSSEHFPHIHPCAIILVKRGNELLLTRKKEWPPGRYGLVAGFLDFGESLEECAAREVLEETGIEICNVRYVGSQNWPFPAQLMAGFVAEYSTGEIEVDQHELEDARWFPADALPVLPPDRSIARWIIDNFK